MSGRRLNELDFVVEIVVFLEQFPLSLESACVACGPERYLGHLVCIVRAVHLEFLLDLLQVVTINLGLPRGNLLVLFVCRVPILHLLRAHAHRKDEGASFLEPLGLDS